jgi:hypothetical protein
MGVLFYVAWRRVAQAKDAGLYRRSLRASKSVRGRGSQFKLHVRVLKC